MRYLSGRSTHRKLYTSIGLGVFAFLLFVYFWPAFRTTAYPLAEPIVTGYGATKGFARILPSFVSSYITSHTILSKKIENLELNVERLENEIAEKDARIRAYDETALAVDGHARSVVVMYPLVEDITNLYSTILLSKGYKDGIEENAMVYVRGRQAVCTVTRVYNETSLCELLSKGKRVVEGVTASSSVVLSLVGEGGGSFIMQIPSDVPIDIGEQVYMRSDHSFTLGTVVSIKKDEQATGSILYVRGAYNPVTSSVLYTDIQYEN